MAAAKEGGTQFGKQPCEGSLGVLETRLRATLESVHGGSRRLYLTGKLSSVVMFLFFHAFFLPQKGLCLFLFLLFCLLVKQTRCSCLGLKGLVLVAGERSFEGCQTWGRPGATVQEGVGEG